MSEPVVRLRNAVVVTNGFPLLSGVDLEIPSQSLTVLTGANGAGKTSLLRLLGGQRVRHGVGLLALRRVRRTARRGKHARIGPGRGPGAGRSQGHAQSR